MPKYTAEQRQQILNIVHEGVKSVKSIAEIRQDLRTHLKIDLSVAETYSYRKKLNTEAHKWMLTFAKTRGAYIERYMTGIERVEQRIRADLDLYEKPTPVKTVVKEVQNPDGTITKVREIHQIDDRDFKRKLNADIVNMQETLMRMYDAAPIVKGMSDIKQHGQVISELQ